VFIQTGPCQYRVGEKNLEFFGAVGTKNLVLHALDFKSSTNFLALEAEIVPAYNGKNVIIVGSLISSNVL